MSKIREEPNADGIGDMENMVANMDEAEQKKFNAAVMRNRSNEEWCKRHRVNFVEADMGVVIRETYVQLYGFGGSP